MRRPSGLTGESLRACWAALGVVEAIPWGKKREAERDIVEAIIRDFDQSECRPKELDREPLALPVAPVPAADSTQLA
jgi:hypothetical protein